MSKKLVSKKKKNSFREQKLVSKNKNSFREQKSLEQKKKNSFREQKTREQKQKLVSWATKKTRFVSSFTSVVSKSTHQFAHEYSDFR